MKIIDDIQDWIEDLMQDVWEVFKMIIRGLLGAILVLGMLGFLILILVALVKLIL